MQRDRVATTLHSWLLLDMERIGARASGETRLPWALVLAGGEGTRLRRLTTAVAGDERPKQFCALLGEETLIDQTRRRAALLTAPDRTVIVLTRSHERYYRPLVSGIPSRCRIIQPEGRGTAPAIVYGLLRIASVDPMATVVMLPSDHWVSDDTMFMEHVRAAVTTVAGTGAGHDGRADLIVLLGIEPDRADPEYGWIDPGDPIPGTTLLRVRRFWEKPPAITAARLMARGSLWNSFVAVARVPTLLALLRSRVGTLYEAFMGVAPAFESPAEEARIDRLYRDLPATDFSQAVLARCPANLATLPVRGVEWSDWGNPRRVLATLARLGVHPAWAAHTAALA